MLNKIKEDLLMKHLEVPQIRSCKRIKLEKEDKQKRKKHLRNQLKKKK